MYAHLWIYPCICIWREREVGKESGEEEGEGGREGDRGRGRQ